MKPSEFISRLLTDITKSDVVEDANLVQERVNKYTLVAYHQASASLKSHKAASPEIIRLESAINMGINDKLADKGVIRAGGKVIENVERALPQMLKNMEVVSELIDKSWNEKATSHGLTYRNANLLQFVSLGTFVDRYSRMFLNHYFVCETARENPETAGFATLNNAEIKWLDENAVSFGNAISIVAVKTDKLKAVIEIMPDMTISRDHAQNAEAALGAEVVDPLRMGFIASWINPIFSIRMKIANWQLSNYEEAKEDLKRLQLRRMFLEEAKSGKHDIRLETELRKTHDKISDLQYKIAVAEERAR